MSREWKPGDVIADKDGNQFWLVEVSGNTEAAAQTGRAWEPGSSAVGADGNGWRLQSIEGKHLVAVIDADDREAVERLTAAYCAQFGHEPTQPEEVSAMQAALREFADPKPPKPDEPRGLGAVVEDTEGLLWVRTEPDAGERVWEKPWLHEGRRRHWQIVAAVRVLSEGVTA